MRFIRVLIPLCLLLTAAQLPAAVYYVSSSLGNDGNTGLGPGVGLAFQTIGHATNFMAAGDTLNVEAGNYPENVQFSNSGTAGNPITVNGPGGGLAVVGSGAAYNGSYRFGIFSKNYITIENLDIAGENGTGAVEIEGTSSHINILNNNIYHITSNSAFAIRATPFGPGPMTDINVVGNTISDVNNSSGSGAGKIIVLEGNVTNSQVSNNSITNAIAFYNGIDIDCGNNACPDGILVKGNVITGMTALGGGGGGGTAIFLDGAHDSTVTANAVGNTTGWSIQAGYTVNGPSGVYGAVNDLISNNIVYGGTLSGINIGTYGTSNGYASNVRVLNNTLYHNSTGSGLGEIAFSGGSTASSNNTFENNIVVPGGSNTFLTEWTGGSAPTGTVFDHNDWYSSAGNGNYNAQTGISYAGLAAWQASPGAPDSVGSINTDPLFISASPASAADFYLQCSSPAKDTGKTEAQVPLDYAGTARPQGPAYDMGAYEISCGSTPTFTPTPTFTRTSTLTPTPTSSMTLTKTLTPTPSVTATPSSSATLTATKTSSSTMTMSPTPSQSSTLTLTPSPTSSATQSSTRTATASMTASPSVTATPSSTLTLSDTPTSTLSPVFTPTTTPTATPSFTQTRTATDSATPSQSPTQSLSPSASVTASVTLTGTPTRSATPSATVTLTPSFSPTQSASPTISPTPLAVPFALSVDVYNQAGERVRSLFNGSAEEIPLTIQISGTAFFEGAGPLALGLPGFFVSSGGTFASLSWDFLNDAGQDVQGGSYTIKAQFTDPFGVVTVLTKSIEVLAKPGSDVLSIFNSAGELVWSQSLSSTAGPIVNISLPAGEKTFAPAYDISGNAQALLWITGTDTTGATQTYAWNGRNSNGLPVASGAYMLQLAEEGTGGGKVLVTRDFTVLDAYSGQSLAGSLVAPNPAPATASSAVVIYPAGPNVTAKASLYSLDGSLLAQAWDLQGSGRIALDCGRFPGGIYFVRIEKFQASALMAQLTLKWALLR